MNELCSYDQIFEFVNAGGGFGHKGCYHRTFGQTFAGEGLVGEGQTVAAASEFHRVDAGNLPFAEGFDVGHHAEPLLHYVSQNLCRAARFIELMDVMSLADVRLITLVLQYRGHLFHGGEKGDDTYREIGRPDEGAAMALELREHFVLDVVPAGSAHHGGLEMLRDKTVVGPERFREGKIYAHRFAGEGRVYRADVFAAKRRFDAPCAEAILNHMTHAAVS